MNWEITDLTVTQQNKEMPNSVVFVGWRCFKNDGEFSSFINGTCGVNPPEASSFVDFNNLQKDTVLNWIWSCGVDKSAVEESVNRKIEEIRNVNVLTAVANPWS